MYGLLQNMRMHEPLESLESKGKIERQDHTKQRIPTLNTNLE